MASAIAEEILFIWDSLLRLHCGSSLRALVDDGQVLEHAFLADDVWVLVVRTALRERGHLRLRPVEIRVVRGDDIGAGLRGEIAEALGRLRVGVEPELRRALGSDVVLRAADPVERRAAPIRDQVRLTV